MQFSSTALLSLLAMMAAAVPVADPQGLNIDLRDANVKREANPQGLEIEIRDESFKREADPQGLEIEI